jgi:hypothetical protein
MLIMEWMGKMRMRIREVGGDIGMQYIGFFTLDIGPEDWKHQFYICFDIEHRMSTSDIDIDINIKIYQKQSLSCYTIGIVLLNIHGFIHIPSPSYR